MHELFAEYVDRERERVIVRIPLGWFGEVEAKATAVACVARWAGVLSPDAAP